MEVKNNSEGTKSRIEYSGYYIVKSANLKETAGDELDNEISVLMDLRKKRFKYHAKIIDAEFGNYIKMEYIEGELLANLLKFKIKTISEEKRNNITESIALTLIEFYKTGYYHNDLAASNIIIKKDTQEAYLIDFGRAKTYGSLEKDLGYFLSNILKVRFKGNFLVNILVYSIKCTFFLKIYFNMFEHIEKNERNKMFLKILKEFYLFEIYIIKNRDFTKVTKLKIILLIFPTIMLCIIKYFKKSLIKK